MKVNYHKTVIERVIDAIQEAKAQNRVIESIELSASEYQELLSHCYQSSLETTNKRRLSGVNDGSDFKFMGVPIHKAPKEVKWKRPAPFRGPASD